ncbi:MAG: radical SAM protein [Methanoregulaceae archaeon]|jgi:7-carboxy-7-deazaguanine synthase|nr:radical SAM protein [Methanoregulaceae archaeon]
MMIAEIFRSIQGEGKSQGYPCTFLRLAGCNLSCNWCDTTYARGEGTDKREAEIISEIESLKGKRICITGGEPLLQGEKLLSLVRDLSVMGYDIEIETNGTFDFQQFQPYASVCMDIKCPSSGEESDLSNLSCIGKKDSVRFVVGDHEDIRFAASVMERFPIRGEIFFSPVYGFPPLAVAEFLVARDLPARLQLQIHKIIGVP